MITRALMNVWNTFKQSEENVHGSYNAAKTIATEHERIHAGKMWKAGEHGSQAAGSIKYVLITVGDTLFHLRDFGADVDQGPYGVTIYESPYIDVNSKGVEMPFVNLNRASIAVTSTQIFKDPYINVNSIGAYIDDNHVLQSTGGSVKSITGVSQGVVTEWILSKNTNYLFAFINSSTNPALYDTRFLGYEP